MQRRWEEEPLQHVPRLFAGEPMQLILNMNQVKVYDSFFYWFIGFLGGHMLVCGEWWSLKWVCR